MMVKVANILDNCYAKSRKNCIGNLNFIPQYNAEARFTVRLISSLEKRRVLEGFLAALSASSRKQKKGISNVIAMMKKRANCASQNAAQKRHSEEE